MYGNTFTARESKGFTLVELMVALVLTLLLTLALVSIFINVSSSQRELKKFNDLVDNGRFAINALSNQLAHAGYWGGHVPQFDNLIFSDTPLDGPTAVPDPCKAYASWTTQDRINMIGIPMQASDVLPSGAGCIGQLTAKAGSDTVVVRGVERCLPGVGNCEADSADRLYLQVSSCAAELQNAVAQSGDTNEIVLANGASDVDDTYVGVMLRITGGLGANQIRWIADYDGASRTASVTTAWATVPDHTSEYAFDYVLGDQSFPLHTRECVGTGTPAILPISSGPVADKRRFLSDLYYIHEFDHPEFAGQKVPSLVRARLDFNDGALAHHAPTALVDGVEAMRVHLGIDDLSDSGEAVSLIDPIDWADLDIRVSPTNRGDGFPDRYVRCTTAAPCTSDDLVHVVSAKIYVLIRARDMTTGHVDDRVYCLGEPDNDGNCPSSSQFGPFEDSYVRHVFSRTVRLPNVSGRRETP